MESTPPTVVIDSGDDKKEEAMDIETTMTSSDNKLDDKKCN